MPSCPKCGSSLRSTGSPLALGCRSCGGLWAREGALDALPPELGGASDPGARAPNDDRTGRCPDDRGILLRARIEPEGAAPFYLERCGGCRGLWFDAGEWARIASMEVRTRLDALWDPAARRAALAERNAAKLEADLRRRLGDALHDRLVELADTLATHPDSAMALAYLDWRLRTGTDAEA